MSGFNKVIPYEIICLDLAKWFPVKLYVQIYHGDSLWNDVRI